MKKILLTMASIASLMLTPLVASAGTPGNWAIGTTLSMNTLDTAGKEVANGVTTKKTVSDDFVVGSLFLENTMLGDKLGVTLGIDYIPFDADIDKRSISQSSVKGRTDGAATTGTNSVSGSISDHTTFYIAPGVKFGENSLFYFSYGIISADFSGKSVSLSHTDISKTKTLTGEKMGLGIRTVKDSGLMLKFEVSEASYDDVGFTTSNGTTGTVDLDNSAFTFSIGKQF